MNKTGTFFIALIGVLFFKQEAVANKNPDTVYTGIYVTSIHNIDFKQAEYTVNLWLWLKYRNKDFDFLNNLEIPQAKNITKSFSTVDSTGNRIYLLMKLQCVMKDSWRINHFPFDHQRLRLSIENSQFDSRSLIFVPERIGKNYDPRFTINGWIIDSLNISTGINSYETAFGDESFQKPHSEYSTFKVKVELERKAFGLFLKIFLGMYVAFLIAYVCFFIHVESVEARFGLNVGALFAVIGNKYVIDSALPESTSFTLVDRLHGITLLSIFAVIVLTICCLYLVKKDRKNSAKKLDRYAAWLLPLVYLALNVFYIWKAHTY